MLRWTAWSADGATLHGMSILSFIPEQGHVCTGIGSRGRYQTYSGGKYDDRVLEFQDESAEGRIRIRIGPFTDPKLVPFNVHSSRDGINWDAVESFDYIRVK